jgi:monovalent cation:H+ antiporter, CPA1 family
MEIELVEILAIAMVVAIVARQFSLPYTVGLVIVGAALSVSKINIGAVLTRDFIFQVILPPLLFEAAVTLPWKDLRADLLPVVVLSAFGTVVSVAAVAAGMMFLLHWPLASALIFAALIAATDPVAVIAMFKDNGVTGRLRLLVESESLFNDGVAALLFTLAVAWAQASDGKPQTLVDLASTMGLTVAGGIAVGLVWGGAAIALAGRTSEPLVEAALTTVAAYGSLLLAEKLHASGVFATVTAGLLMGNLGILRADDRNILSLKGREFVVSFWEFAAFLANSVIFPLIGISVASIPFETLWSMPILVVICIVLLSRGVSVYPLCLLFLRSRRPISMPEQHVLWWGGLRGALALALALSLPQSAPLRDAIVVATFGVVVFSIVIQGLTMPPLLRRLGFLPKKMSGREQ